MFPFIVGAAALGIGVQASLLDDWNAKRDRINEKYKLLQQEHLKASAERKAAIKARDSVLAEEKKKEAERIYAEQKQLMQEEKEHIQTKPKPIVEVDERAERIAKAQEEKKKLAAAIEERVAKDIEEKKKLDEAKHKQDLEEEAAVKRHQDLEDYYDMLEEKRKADIDAKLKLEAEKFEAAKKLVLQEKQDALNKGILEREQKVKERNAKSKDYYDFLGLLNSEIPGGADRERRKKEQQQREEDELDRLERIAMQTRQEIPTFYSEEDDMKRRFKQAMETTLIKKTPVPIKVVQAAADVADEAASVTVKSAVGAGIVGGATLGVSKLTYNSLDTIMPSFPKEDKTKKMNSTQANRIAKQFLNTLAKEPTRAYEKLTTSHTDDEIALILSEAAKYSGVPQDVKDSFMDRTQVDEIIEKHRVTTHPKIANTVSSAWLNHTKNTDYATISRFDRVAGQPTPAPTPAAPTPATPTSAPTPTQTPVRKPSPTRSRKPVVKTPKEEYDSYMEKLINHAYKTSDEMAADLGKVSYHAQRTGMRGEELHMHDKAFSKAGQKMMDLAKTEKPFFDIGEESLAEQKAQQTMYDLAGFNTEHPLLKYISKQSANVQDAFGKEITTIAMTEGISMNEAMDRLMSRNVRLREGNFNEGDKVLKEGENAYGRGEPIVASIYKRNSNVPQAGADIISEYLDNFETVIGGESDTKIPLSEFIKNYKPHEKGYFMDDHIKKTPQEIFKEEQAAREQQAAIQDQWRAANRIEPAAVQQVQRNPAYKQVQDEQNAQQAQQQQQVQPPKQTLPQPNPYVDIAQLNTDPGHLAFSAPMPPPILDKPTMFESTPFNLGIKPVPSTMGILHEAGQNLGYDALSAATGGLLAATGMFGPAGSYVLASIFNNYLKDTAQQNQMYGPTAARVSQQAKALATGAFETYERSNPNYVETKRQAFNDFMQGKSVPSANDGLLKRKRDDDEPQSGAERLVRTRNELNDLGFEMQRQNPLATVSDNQIISAEVDQAFLPRASKDSVALAQKDYQSWFQSNAPYPVRR